jgi:sporulation protein YlmC with PRC-barrel domain
MPMRVLAVSAMLVATIPAALAQSASPSAGIATTNRQTFIQSQAAADWRASQLAGGAVYGPDDIKIGNIGDILLDSTGHTRAVVIGVGGFLGVGEKNVAVPFNALTVTASAGGDRIEKISVKYTKAELKDAPSFTYRKVPAALPEH